MAVKRGILPGLAHGVDLTLATVVKSFLLEGGGFVRDSEVRSRAQERRANTDSENELMVTRGKEGGGIDWEFGIDRYTLLYLKCICVGTSLVVQWLRIRLPMQET